MDAVWERGLGLIRTVQVVHGPVADAVFKALTLLGDGRFALLLVPLLLWCLDTGLGVRLLLLYLLSAYLNDGLKAVFAHPRPFDLDLSVQRFVAVGYGLPRGHAQAAVVVWGAIASRLRRGWAWPVAIALMVLIGFSRIYLGVHFPTDVLGGWAVGIVLLALYRVVEKPLAAWLDRACLTAQLALTLVPPLLLLIVHRSADAVAAIATMMGAAAGLVLARRTMPYSLAGPWWRRALRLPVGLATLAAMYLALSLVLPADGQPLHALLQVVRYCALGLWLGLGAPWLFRLLKLAQPG